MNSDRKPSRKGRGRSYNMDEIIDLYDEGYSYREIASRMNIKSVQSLRHSVEKFLRERERKWAEISEEDRRKEREMEEERRMREIAERRRRQPQVTGVLTVYGDGEDLEAFREACDGLGIVYREYGNAQEFFFPQSIPDESVGEHLGIYWKYVYKFREWYSNYKNESISTLKYFLFSLGFYLTVEKGKPEGSELRILASHDREGSIIDSSIIINGYIIAIDGGSLYSLKKDLVDWTSTGRMNINVINSIKMPKQDDIGAVRHRLKVKGYYFRLHHDPSISARKIGRTYIVLNDTMVLVRNIGADRIIQLSSPLSSTTDELLEYFMAAASLKVMNSSIKYFTGKGMSDSQMEEMWLEVVKSNAMKRTLRELDPIFFPLLGDRDKLIRGQDTETMDALKYLFQSRELSPANPGDGQDISPLPVSNQ